MDHLEHSLVRLANADINMNTLSPTEKRIVNYLQIRCQWCSNDDSQSIRRNL